MKKWFIFLLFITGCAGAWSPVGGPFLSPNRAFTVDLPQGWMKFNAYDGLLISRDGLFLQSILIERLPLGPSSSEASRGLDRSMAPMKAADVMADYLLSRKFISMPSLQEKGPTAIDGRPGFKLLYTFKNPEGLTYKGVYYGVMIGDEFIGLRYLAVERYYFEKDIGTFQQVLKSFKSG